MQKRTLGRTGIEITPLGLGAWQFSNARGLAGKFWPPLDDIPFQSIIEATLEGGVNWFDTAEMYGGGESERCLAGALHSLGKSAEDVVIATKWKPFLRNASSLLRTIDERKACTSPYPIGLHQIHMPYSFSGVEEEMRVMARLMTDGHIGAAGISNYRVAQMRRAHAALVSHGFVLASNQMEYNLLNRRIEGNGVLDAAKELGITIIAYCPLAQGLVTGRYHEDPGLLRRRSRWRRIIPPYGEHGLRRSQPVVDAVRRIAQKHDATPAQVALNWVVNFHGDTVVAIPGATKLAQAEQNVSALQFTLSPDELDELDRVSRPFIEKPYRIV